MAAKSGIYVEGLREITRGMEKAGVEVDDLKDVMATIAAEAADTMRGYVPHRTGRLVGTVRGNRAKGNATVTIGTARVPYARVINYGWAKRNIRPANFIDQTDQVMETRTAELLEQGWADITERHGLT